MRDGPIVSEDRPARSVGASWYHELADVALAGSPISRENALAVLASSDDDLLPLLDAAFRVRRATFGLKVKLNVLVNAKSGICPEDCGYCSQSVVSTAPIERYQLLSREEILAGAQAAWDRKAGTYCIVASGRRPSARELREVADAVREIKARLPLKICACLGLLDDAEARTLREAGVDRYNHNLNTSRDHHTAITTTHTYDDRVATLEAVRRAGISPCAGFIAGMGETDEQIVDVAFALRELDADSIPVNFRIPVPGTPLFGLETPDARRCLRILALLRFTCPTKELRVAGGREASLGSLQPLALYPANAIFLGDYLTEPGQEAEADYRMIADLGFEIEECAL